MSYREELQRIRLLGIEREKKPRKPLNKKSAKTIAKEAIEKEELAGEDTHLQKWYKARQLQLTGRCIRCGHIYDKNNLKYAICATAHVLAKRPTMFPSVALHPENFIELGSFCGCHNFYDNNMSWEEIYTDKIWPIVLEKFLIIEPSIKERDKIPEILLQEIKPKI